MNSVGTGQGGFDIAQGVLQEPMLIPPQQGTVQGAPGTFPLAYHLNRTVNIDVGMKPPWRRARQQLWTVSTDGLLRW
jgi:hypothetical protein